MEFEKQWDEYMREYGLNFVSLEFKDGRAIEVYYEKDKLQMDSFHPGHGSGKIIGTSNELD